MTVIELHVRMSRAFSKAIRLQSVGQKRARGSRRATGRSLVMVLASVPGDLHTPSATALVAFLAAPLIHLALKKLNQWKKIKTNKQTNKHSGCPKRKNWQPATLQLLILYKTQNHSVGTSLLPNK